MKDRALWVTWERQRRSVELANALGIQLFAYSSNFIDSLPSYLRYPYLITVTIIMLLKKRPNIVFAQNPSIVLATLVCISKKIFRFMTVIDRHSNFKLDKSGNFKWKAFHYLSIYTIRRADLTIVTNTYLCSMVETWGGRGVVLQDKIPSLPGVSVVSNMEDIKKVVVISSFGVDEPIEEVISAAELLDNEGFILYVTGKVNKKRIRGLISLNLIFTGFLPEKDYLNLLLSSDVVVVLTKEEHTLTCGAYEAVSAEKPMVLSDTKEIREYFRKGAIYCKPTPESIASAVKECLSRMDILREEILDLKNEINVSWCRKFNEIKKMINI